jgi:putative ABC transport system substrate-binding protein
MRRRELITAAGAAAATAPFYAHAQSVGRTYRLGILGIAARGDPVYDAFYAALRGRGFVEGRNLVVDLRASEGREDRHAAFAAEIVAMNPDVIVAVGSAATLAAHRLTRTIPIVMAAVPNPERLGLVESLARPGGNVTGVSTMLGDLNWKLLDLSREIMPERSRVGVFWNSSNPGSAATRKRGLPPGFAAIDFEVRSEADIEPGFARLVEARAELLIPHPVVWSYRDRILELAAKHRIPVIFVFREWAAAGALFTYGPDLREQWRLAAFSVVKILNGANPAQLPVQQATKFELLINLRTARALGIDFPSALLTAADEVIE